MNRYVFSGGETQAETKPLFVKPHIKKNKKIKRKSSKNKMTLREIVDNETIANAKRRDRFRGSGWPMRVCSICGFNIDDDQDEFQTLCEVHAARIRQIEKGVEDRGMLIFNTICFGLMLIMLCVLAFMWIHK